MAGKFAAAVGVLAETAVGNSGSCVGKSCLVEDKMSRCNDAMGGEIKAAIASMVWRISKKNTFYGSRSKFVRGGG
jgi:hypothetical protein